MRFGQRLGSPGVEEGRKTKKMAGEFAYCHGDVTIHARDEVSSVLMKEVIPGRS